MPTEKLEILWPYLNGHEVGNYTICPGPVSFVENFQLRKRRRPVYKISSFKNSLVIQIWPFNFYHMTYDQLLATPQHWLFQALSGSHAYGTALPTSDRDTRGVFVLPRTEWLGLHYTPQVADERNDHIWYELGRIVELLAQNNPNALELLAMPGDCILYRHPLYEWLRPELFLSKQCLRTFAGYAQTQIRKARGLNKKILTPLPPERRGVLDFCYVTQGGGSVPLRTWLAQNDYRQEQCGLVNLPHFRDVYALYYDESGSLGFSGVVRREETANEVALSPVTPGLHPLAYLSFNKDGYQTYCKDYREYRAWVELRNEERYQNTLAHGKQYDAKNMLHTFRLLLMAGDIARQGQLVVRRPERDLLLAIRRGEFEYEDLVARAEEKLAALEKLFLQSSLPEAPDLERINEVLVAMREEWYSLTEK